MEENTVKIEKTVSATKRKGKKILCIISILLAVLAILFGVLAYYYSTDEKSSWYSSQYSEAKSAIAEAEKEMDEFENKMDEFLRETGISFQEASPTIYYDYLDTHEKTVQALEELADESWNTLQEFKMRTTIFGVLSAACVIGAIVIFFFSKKGNAIT